MTLVRKKKKIYQNYPRTDTDVRTGSYGHENTDNCILYVKKLLTDKEDSFKTSN